MGIRASRVGVTIDDTIIVRNDAAPYGGITGASWTISVVSGTTDVANTGITITEIDSALRPGEYDLSCSGATSFCANPGVYTVQAYITAQPQYSFAMTYYVADGTFAATAGPAVFTSSTGQGRVTNGSTPIQGATVTILSGSTVIGQLTTNSAGNWGPIYLAAGTYTVVVQNSGYSTNNSATLTVVGSTVTGPGSDIVITAASTNTPLNAGTQMAYARKMARNASGSLSDQDMLDVVNEAMDMISMEKVWPWFLVQGCLQVNGAQTTPGTLTLTNGSNQAQIVGGTWPTWATDSHSKLRYNGQVLPIQSQASSTVLNLVTAWNGASVSGQPYVVFQDEYDLPNDFMLFDRLLPGQNWGYGGTPVGYTQILELLNEVQYGQHYANCWAIHQGRIVLYPWPDQSLLVPFSYYQKPAPVTASTSTINWDPQQTVLLRRAIDYMVSLRYEGAVVGTPKECLERYQEQLALSKSNDETSYNRDSPILLSPLIRRRRHFTSPDNG